MTPEPYLTREALANHLSCDPTTVSKWHAYGLPYHIVGQSKRYRLSEVEEWIAERTAAARQRPIRKAA